MKLTENLENVSLVSRLDQIPGLTAKRHVLFTPLCQLPGLEGHQVKSSLTDLTCVWKAARGLWILPQQHGVALAELSTTSSAWEDLFLANTVLSLVLLSRHFFFV